MDKKVVAISGYFTVLHKGHIDYMREAKKLGNYLVVIINNNEQQSTKKGKLIHDVEDIKKVIEVIKYVDEVVISIDKDGSVCKTLEMVKPDIFANGGDRFNDNIPEVQTCRNNNIKTIFNVGGKKTLSSSEILSKSD